MSDWDSVFSDYQAAKDSGKVAPRKKTNSKTNNKSSNKSNNTSSNTSSPFSETTTHDGIEVEYTHLAAGNFDVIVRDIGKRQVFKNRTLEVTEKIFKRYRVPVPSYIQGLLDKEDYAQDNEPMFVEYKGKKGKLHVVEVTYKYGDTEQKKLEAADACEIFEQVGTEIPQEILRESEKEDYYSTKDNSEAFRRDSMVRDFEIEEVRSSRKKKKGPKAVEDSYFA